MRRTLRRHRTAAPSRTLWPPPTAGQDARHTGRGHDRTGTRRPSPERDSPITAKLLVMLRAGAAVAVALGVYANQHTPTDEKPYTLFFSGMIQLKVWFATLALRARLRAAAARRPALREDLDPEARSRRGSATRTGSPARSPSSSRCPSPTSASGRSGSRRGAPACCSTASSAAPSTACSSSRCSASGWKGLPGWVLPVAGGLVFAALVGVFLTAAVWFFTSSRTCPLF